MNQITSKINMELQQRQWQPAIDVVQNDRYMRNLELSLTSGGEAWSIPEEASVVIRYLRSDGIGGEYDTLSDGTQAWSSADNKLTVILAPEMMTVSGLVQLWVTIIRMEQQISSFALALNVSALAQADEGDTGVFANTTGFLPAPFSGEVGQSFRVRAVNDRGQVTEVETMDLGAEAVLHKAQSLTQEQQAQARANIGAAGIGETSGGALLWEPLTLTEKEKQQARKNIGAMATPSGAEIGQVIAVKAVDENGVPVEWETISVQGGTISNAVLYAEQVLSDAQKAQARMNIGTMEDKVYHHSYETTFHYPDNGTVLLNHFIRYGNVCTFTIQLNITQQINDSYGFTIMTLPFACSGRLWLNNATSYYIEDNSRNILRNASSTPVGSITLSGVYITNE